MVSLTNHMFESSSSTIIKYSSSDEHNLSSKIQEICTNNMYTIDTESMSTSKSSSIIDFYPESYSSSSSSISSFDNHPHHMNISELKTFSSSSGYNSSLNSIPDHFFLSSTDCNLDEQFLSLHLQNQTSFSSEESPLSSRKYLQNNQVSSDTDDESQSTIIISSQKRPRSLPIAIQSSKYDNDTSFSHCTINRKNSLEHFIMSPTDKVKIQMKYQENHNELKLSQPEDIDFKRSKLKAIRILYQNRLHLNSIQSPKSKTIEYCDSPLAKRTINPRLLRSVISYSVFEVDDEHEVVSTRNRSNVVNGTHEKSPHQTFNCLRINFTESLLNGKILPCDILDGFTIKLGASGVFIPKQVILPVTTFWFNISEHQAASPYLGFINLQCLPKRGYHTPIKGTITLALLNPNGTAIHLFLILYDLSDMPADHRTFIRQRILLQSDNIDEKQSNLRYLAHIRFVTSQTGKLYMHSDIRLIFARNKLDYDERTGNGKPQLITLTDMPTPKYWSRK